MDINNDTTEKLVSDFAEWSKKYPRGGIYSTGSKMDDQLIALEERAKILTLQPSPLPLIDKGEPEPESFLPPDNGDICWETGAETFTRKEVYYLLYTQRSMISNDLKRYAGESLTPNILDVLHNPRIPKY